MKHFFTVLALFFNCIAFAQSGRHILDMHVQGAHDIEKAFVKDYGSYQLTGGVYRDDQYNAFFWIAKMNDNTVTWAKSFPAPFGWYPMDINPFDITECNANGDLLFIARNMGSIETGHYTAKILKLNSSGNLLWSKEFVAQEFYSQTVYENNPLIVENDGVVISMAGENDLVISKIDDSGNLVYSKQLQVTGSAGGVSPGHLFIPNNQGGYFAGFENGNSAVVVKLDAALNPVWARRIPTGEQTRLRSVCQKGTSLFLGGAGDSEFETYIAKLDLNGNLLDYRVFTDSLMYSMDQLLDWNDSTLLANTRAGYAFIHTNDWSYDITGLDYSLNSLNGGLNGWTLSHPWGNDYFLDFDLFAPECIGHRMKENQMSTPFSVTTETINCTVSDHGNLVPYSVQLTNMNLTVSNDCYLTVAEQVAPELTVYPNPVLAGSVLSFSNEFKNATITWLDLQGKTISESIFSQQVHVPLLSAGIYLINIRDKKGLVATQRIVVE